MSGTNHLIQPVTPEQKKLRAAKIGLSINAQETANILSTQAVTSVALSGALYAHANDDQPEHIHADEILAEDKEIGIFVGLLFSAITTVIWLVNNKKNLEEHKRLKNQLNPWYRRFKSAAFLGNNIGQLAAEFIVIGFSFLPDWMLMPFKALISNLVGVIVGVLAAVFIPNDAEIISDKAKSIFRMGRDGWARYAKVGMKVGNIIGNALGSFLPIPGSTPVLMAIGTALGGIIGFICFAVFVPVINKIRYWLNPDLRFNKSSDNLLNNSDSIVDVVTPMLAQHQYRTNYIAMGMSYGSAIGAIAAILIFTFLLVNPPFTLIIFIGWVAGATALACGILFGFVGHHISVGLSPHDKSYSSWDYGARTGISMGNQYGLGIFVFGMLSLFGLDKVMLGMKDLIYSVGTVVFGFIFGLYDAIVTRRMRDISDDDFEKNKPLVPLSQRTATFIMLGGFLGGAIGFLIGGPIGLMIGTGLGGVLCGGIGMIWGEWFYEKYAQLSGFISQLICTELPEEQEMNPTLKAYKEMIIQSEKDERDGVHDHDHEEVVELEQNENEAPEVGPRWHESGLQHFPSLQKSRPPSPTFSPDPTNLRSNPVSLWT